VKSNSEQSEGPNEDRVRRRWSEACRRLIRYVLAALLPPRQDVANTERAADLYGPWRTLADLLGNTETAQHVLKLARLVLFALGLIVIIVVVIGAVLIVHPEVVTAFAGVHSSR